MIIKDFIDDAEKLKIEFDAIYEQLSNSVSKSQFSSKESIQNKYGQIKKLILSKKGAYSLTEEKKIQFYMKELESELGITLPEEDLDGQINFIENEINKFLTSLENNSLQETENLAAQLTSQNKNFPLLGEFITQVESLISEMTDLQLLNGLKKQRTLSCHFAYQFLTAFIDKIDYAKEFLEEKEDFLNWLSFIEKQDTLTQSLIQSLSKQKADWLETFENWYLNSYVQSNLSQANSASELADEILGKKEVYTNRFFKNLLIQILAEAKVNNFETSESWLDLLVNHSENLSNRFPIVLCKADFYLRYRDLLLSSYQTVVCSNTYIVSSAEPDLLFFTNDSMTAKRLYSQSEFELINVPDAKYTINRHLEKLSIHELSRCALYLGQEMKKYNNNFRIFLIGQTTVVSFFNQERNSRLLEHFRGQGIKELFSNDSSTNLLPGIISNLETWTVFLVEDNVFSWKHADLSSQIEIIQDMKLAGLNVLSIDNYELMTQDGYSLESILDKIEINQLAKRHKQLQKAEA